MGDKSPKNLHKKEVQHHDKVVEKVHEKQHNAEVQHHPHSGHPPVPEVEAAPESDAIGK